MTTGFMLVRRDAGTSANDAPAEPQDDARVEPQCHVCQLLQPQYRRYYDEIERLRLEGKNGARVGLSTIADDVNRMLIDDKVPKIRLQKAGLSNHFRFHASASDRTSYAMMAAQRSPRRVVKLDASEVQSIQDFVPPSLMRGNLAAEGADRLAENLGDLQRIMDELERRIDGNEEVLSERIWIEDLNIAVTKPLPTATALALFGHLSTVMQRGLALLAKTSDPRQTVGQFLFRVLRMMQRDVIRAAQTQFMAMARECSQEQDADRWQDWCVRHGTEFAKALDAVAQSCDQELMRVIGETGP